MENEYCWAGSGCYFYGWFLWEIRCDADQLLRSDGFFVRWLWKKLRDCSKSIDWQQLMSIITSWLLKQLRLVFVPSGCFRSLFVGLCCSSLLDSMGQLRVKRCLYKGGLVQVFLEIGKNSCFSILLDVALFDGKRRLRNFDWKIFVTYFAWHIVFCKYEWERISCKNKNTFVAMRFELCLWKTALTLMLVNH